MKCYGRIFRCLLRRRDGATAIEFAFILPVLILFIFGIFEFGLIMHVSSLVENAAHEGSRYAITGNTYEDLNPDGMPREEFIEQYIRKRIGLWIQDDEQLSIQTTVVGDIVDLGKSDPNAIEDGGLGAGGQAVIYNIDYYWRIMTPIMANIIGEEDGTFRITSTVVVKNEDFCGQRRCF